MSEKFSSIFTNVGHEEVLKSIQEKHQFDLINTFKSSFTLCAVALLPSNEKVFVTIKGYKNNESNENRFQSAIIFNRMAQRIKNNFMPKVIEFNSFERSNVLWMTSMSTYEGDPISRGEFFDGNDAKIDGKMIKLLHHFMEVISRSDSGEFYTAQKVSTIIKATFGHRVISVAPEWTSAHCDLHWGNILNGGVFIDWDTFSKAPKGLDAASVVLFSVSNSKLFERLYMEFSDILQTDSGKVATLLEATRIYYRMRPQWKLYEANIREAVMLIVKPKKIRWPKISEV